jgi:hypothetical protein
MKKEKGDLLADFHIISNRCKNYFSHLFNVHRVRDDKQMSIYIYTGEPQLPEPSLFGVEILLKSWKHINRYELTKLGQTRVSIKF